MTLGPDTRTRRVGTLVIHLVAAAVPDGPELLHDWGYAKGVPRGWEADVEHPAGSFRGRPARTDSAHEQFQALLWCKPCLCPRPAGWLPCLL